MPGAGGLMGAEYGSDGYTNAMRLAAMGDILRGGNGASFFNYMQQQAAAKQADAQRAAAAIAAQEEEAQRQAMMQAAEQGLGAFFSAQIPNPVSPFNRDDAAGNAVAADAMAYVRPEMFPGLSQDTINSAARGYGPQDPAAASALISMFYNMPDDMGQRTKAGLEGGDATFSYNDQDAREWARENAPDYGYGFSGDNPTAQYGAQQSMPTPIAPERLSQIMMNPMIPKEVKDQVMARFQQADPKMQWIDGVGMVDMNNPPPELMAGQYKNNGDREIRNDPNGVPRYVDTGEPVFPNAGPAEAGPDFETEQKLRKEYDSLPIVKDFATVQQGWDRIQSAAEDPSPAGDLGLIFSFMKVMDPGSVVRESEFATAESAAAWLQEAGESGIDVPLPVAAAIRRMGTGQRLSPEQRADFVRQAAGFYNRHAERVNAEVEDYRRLADEYGLEPDRIARAVETYQVDPETAAQIEAEIDRGGVNPDDLNPVAPQGGGASGPWGPQMPQTFTQSAEVQALASRLGVSVDQLWQQIVQQGRADVWLR